MVLILLNGRRTRKARSAVRLFNPGTSPIQPKTTTRKSNTFQGSRKYVLGLRTKPRAIILTAASAVNTIKNQISESSTRVFRHDFSPSC